MRTAVFAGLIVDETGKLVEVSSIGGEPHYVVDDQGFLRHIPSDKVDSQVFVAMQQMVMENRDMVVEGMLQYVGSDDLFTKAAVEASILQMNENMAKMLEMGLPEETRAWLGLMGFKVVIDIHGDVIDMAMPSGTVSDE